MLHRWPLLGLLPGALPLLLPACVAPGGGGPGPAAAAVHREAPGALGPYAGSVEAAGLVFASGKIAAERGGEFRAEAAGALEAVEAELARAGLGWGDVVAVTVHLTDIELYGVFNEVYGARLPAPYPARTCVAVAALPGGARVEVTVVAAR